MGEGGALEEARGPAAECDKKERIGGKEANRKANVLYLTERRRLTSWSQWALPLIFKFSRAQGVAILGWFGFLPVLELPYTGGGGEAQREPQVVSASERSKPNQRSNTAGRYSLAGTQRKKAWENDAMTSSGNDELQRQRQLRWGGKRGTHSGGMNGSKMRCAVLQGRVHYELAMKSHAARTAACPCPCSLCTATLDASITESRALLIRVLADSGVLFGEVRAQAGRQGGLQAGPELRVGY
jgi:hypothetical protein